jgi:NAD(P)-dependent dehydrogenase (short-subunit alcohol dehydrogenase family)
MEIKSSTCLITGGASGLGAACSRRLAEAGAQIVIADLNEDAGQSLAAELGKSARFVRTDVTSPDEAQKAIDTAVRDFGELHGLVQCAGILGAARIAGKDGPHDLELFQRVIHVNLIGTFNMLRLATAEMSKLAPLDNGERGVVINTASVAAYDGQIGQAAYSASKGGIVGMTLPIARELAQFGIRVLTIAPGLFLTPLLGSLPQEAQDSLAAAIPFPHRLGQPEEFALLAMHMIDNPYLNGEVVRLDASLRMAPR